MDYRHTQTGYTAIVVGLWLLVIVLIVVAVAGEETRGAVIVAAAFAAFIAVVAFVFSRLTVTVGAGEVKTAFGWGWPRRAVDTLDISAFRPVRNKWYYGWGIRLVPGGWLWNVWGLDAVEIDLRSGKKFRIGTDEPADLVAALALHTSLRPSDES